MTADSVLETIRYTIPRRYDPSYSVLGLLFRRRVSDEFRAQNYHLLAGTFLLLLFLISNHLMWALGGTERFLAPEWLRISGIYAGTCILFAGLGFARSVRISLATPGMQIRRGRHHWSVAFQNIEDVSVISAEAYHWQFRRAPACVCFVNRLSDQLLKVKTPSTTIIIGLRPEDHEMLLHQLENILADAQVSDQSEAKAVTT